MKASWQRKSGFTVVEFLVLFGIAIILLSIFIPAALKAIEMSRRTQCVDNLRRIYTALDVYQKSNDHKYPRVVYDETGNPNGYVAYTGADDENPFAADSAVQPNDVTASLWLLVRGGLVNTGVFICPSSDDSRDLLTDATNIPATPARRGNFRKPLNLSYSYASPFTNASGFRLDYDVPGDFALVADKNPGISAPGDDVVSPAWNAPVIELSKANSANHGKAGQNVLHAGGSVRFEKTPYSGAGTIRGPSDRIITGGDNIYTVLSDKPWTEKIPANANGFLSHALGPTWQGDSFLIPTVHDEPGPPRPASQPSTAPAPTTQTATTLTAATQTSTTQAATTLPTTIPTTAPTTQQ